MSITRQNLSVIIVSYKSENVIENCINSIDPQIEIIVIDNSNNYSFGVREHIIFPEVNFDKVEKIRGLDITIIMSSLSKDHSLELLRKLNFPFKEERNN